MRGIKKGSFDPSKLVCPVCDADLLPPDPNICEHIAFYWVLGPAEDPFFEFILPEYTIAPDDLLDTKRLQKNTQENELKIYALEEQGADYPTQIILGVKQGSS